MLLENLWLLIQKLLEKLSDIKWLIIILVSTWGKAFPLPCCYYKWVRLLKSFTLILLMGQHFSSLWFFSGKTLQVLAGFGFNWSWYHHVSQHKIAEPNPQNYFPSGSTADLKYLISVCLSAYETSLFL